MGLCMRYAHCCPQDNESSRIESLHQTVSEIRNRLSPHLPRITVPFSSVDPPEGTAIESQRAEHGAVIKHSGIDLLALLST